MQPTEQDIQPFNERELQRFITWTKQALPEAEIVHEQFQKDLQRHVGSDSTYNQKSSILLSLHILFKAFIEKKISTDLLFNIIEQAQKCTHGFDSALQMFIIMYLRFPQNFEDFLAIVRQNFIQKFAIQAHSDVHIQNQILMFASQQFFTQVSNPYDPAVINTERFRPIAKDLEKQFNHFYNVFQIIIELEKTLYEWTHQAGYQDSGENETATIELIEQLFKNIFNQIPTVKSLIDYEQHHPENLSVQSLQQELFDLLEQTHIKEANLKTITTIFSDTESQVFKDLLTANQQSFIIETSANDRKSPSRYFEKIKHYLKEQDIYFGSKEMIFENLTGPSPRPSFNLWYHHINQELREMLMTWKKKFQDTQQISGQIKTQLAERKLAFHEYFWDENRLNQNNIRLAIWHTLLKKDYIYIKPHHVPFIEKVNDVIQATWEEKHAFFADMLHFYRFSEQHLYLFEFLGLSKNPQSMTMLQHFLKDFWYCHLLSHNHRYELACKTLQTFKSLGFQPSKELIQVFIEAPKSLKKNEYQILIHLIQIIENTTEKQKLIKSWPLPSHFDYYIKVLQHIPLSAMRLELICFWNVQPETLKSLHQITFFIANEQRLNYINAHIELFKKNHLQIHEIQAFAKYLNDSDKVSFLRNLIMVLNHKIIIKDAYPSLSPLFRNEEALKEYRLLIQTHFIETTEQMKQLFLTITDDVSFQQVLTGLPKINKMQIDDMLTITKELSDERKVMVYSNLMNQNKMLFDFVLKILKSISSQEQRMHFLKRHAHLIYIDLLPSIIKNLIDEEHHHELIILLLKQTKFINHEMCLKILALVPREKRFELMNIIFESIINPINIASSRLFPFIFGQSTSQNFLLDFVIQNPQMLTNYSFMLTIMNVFTPTQNTHWFTQSAQHLLSLCASPEQYIFLFHHMEKNLEFFNVLSQIKLDLLIDIIFFSKNEYHITTSEIQRTQKFLLAYMVNHGHFLMILQRIEKNPHWIHGLFELFNPETNLALLFDERTKAFFKNCSWIYPLILKILPQKEHILQQHILEQFSHEEWALMLSNLQSVQRLIKTSHFYFLISFLDQSSLFAFFHQHPNAFIGLINILSDGRHESNFFEHLEDESKIKLFELMISHHPNALIPHVFENLLLKLPQTKAKALFLKYLQPDMQNLMSLDIFKTAILSLEIQIQEIEPYLNVIQRLIEDKIYENLNWFLIIIAKRISSVEQAIKWLDIFIELSNTHENILQYVNYKITFWQFYDDLSIAIKKQILIPYIQSHPGFFWSNEGFHQLLKAENSFKKPFFGELISCINVTNQSLDFNQFLSLYKEIKSKSKTKDYTSYKILFLEAYGRKLFHIMPKIEQLMMFLSLESDNPMIFQTIEKYLAFAPFSYVDIIFLESSPSLTSQLLLGLSPVIQQYYQNQLYDFALFILIILRHKGHEQADKFIRYNQEIIQKMRFRDIYQFEALNCLALEQFFHHYFLNLILDATIEILNQNYDFLYHYIQSLSLKNNNRHIEKILLNPKLTCIHSLEQVLALSPFLSSKFMIQHMLAKPWRKEEVCNARYLYQEQILIGVYLELYLSSETQLQEIFINPLGWKEDYKQACIEHCENEELKQIILTQVEVQEYLRLDLLILNEFKETIFKKATQTHMHFFSNPCYQQLYDALQGKENSLTEESLHQLKNDPELKIYFSTTVIRVHLEELLSEKILELPMRSVIKK